MIRGLVTRFSGPSVGKQTTQLQFYIFMLGRSQTPATPSADK